jgi:hypothetical protein
LVGRKVWGVLVVEVEVVEVVVEVVGLDMVMMGMGIRDWVGGKRDGEVCCLSEGSDLVGCGTIGMEKEWCANLVRRLVKKCALAE